MAVHPVVGRVTFRGEPAEGAEVSFFGEDQALRAPDAPFPRAVVRDDGTFSVTSYEPDDGAPAGEYRVTVVWRRSNAADPEIRDQAPDVLRGRYALPETTSLTAKVVPGDNQLAPFDLK